MFFGFPKKKKNGNPKKSLELRKIAIKIATELGSRRKNTPEKAETMENLAAIPKMREIFLIRTIFRFAKPKKNRPKKFFGFFLAEKCPKKIFGHTKPSPQGW